MIWPVWEWTYVNISNTVIKNENLSYFRHKFTWVTYKKGRQINHTKNVALSNNKTSSASIMLPKFAKLVSSACTFGISWYTIDDHAYKCNLQTYSRDQRNFTQGCEHRWRQITHVDLNVLYLDFSFAYQWRSSPTVCDGFVDFKKMTLFYFTWNHECFVKFSNFLYHYKFTSIWFLI